MALQLEEKSMIWLLVSTHAIWSRPWWCNAVQVADSSFALPTTQQRKKKIALDMKNQILSHLGNINSYLSFVVLQALRTLGFTLFTLIKPPSTYTHTLPRLILAHEFFEGTEVNFEVGN